MEKWRQAIRKYYWAVVGPMALLLILGRILKWDVAEVELSSFGGTYPILVQHSHRISTSGMSRSVSRTQTYLLLPTTIDVPYTVTVKEVDGLVVVEKDRYAVFKFLVIVLVVAPLLRAAAVRLEVAKGQRGTEP